MRIYISGPITNNQNYMEDFERAERRLKEEYPDAEIINPAKISQLLPKSFSWGDYMAICIPLVFRADIVYLLEDWENSKGACLEKEIAEQCDKTIEEE